VQHHYRHGKLVRCFTAQLVLTAMLQGVPPASLAEFTLNSGGVDYYDGT